MGSEAHAAGLVQAQRRDDALEGAGDALAGATEPAVGIQRDASADQEGRLPSGAAWALATSCLGGDVDGIGADDGGAVQIQARGRHLEADQRDDRLDLALLGLGAVLDLGDGGREAVVVDLERGATVPEAGQEVGDGERRALQPIGRGCDPGLLEVGAGDIGAAHRLHRLGEALQLPQVGGVVAHVSRGQRLVVAEREAVAGLTDLVLDLLATLDEAGENLGGVAGELGQGVSQV